MDRDPENFECTRDPIFFLESRQYHLIDYPDFLGFDGDGWWFEDDADEDISSFYHGEPEDPEIDEKELYKWLAKRESRSLGTGVPYAIEHWQVEGVYLTRNEAERFAELHAYRYKYGWRVYCTPCDGLLAKLLNELPEMQNA